MKALTLITFLSIIFIKNNAIAAPLDCLYGACLGTSIDFEDLKYDVKNTLDMRVDFTVHEKENKHCLEFYNLSYNDKQRVYTVYVKPSGLVLGYEFKKYNEERFSDYKSPRAIKEHDKLITALIKRYGEPTSKKVFTSIFGSPSTRLFYSDEKKHTEERSITVKFEDSSGNANRGKLGYEIYVQDSDHMKKLAKRSNECVSDASLD